MSLINDPNVRNEVIDLLDSTFDTLADILNNKCEYLSPAENRKLDTICGKVENLMWAIKERT